MAERDLIVRLRGLPFSCTESELRTWIGGRDIDKVHLPVGRDGRPSGEGFVIFSSQSAFDEALKKDREHMGHRYVEVFPGTSLDLELTTRRRERDNRSPGNGRPDRRDRFDRDRGFDSGPRRGPGGPPPFLPRGEFVVRLRGLPFGVSREEIYKFFSPLEIVRDGIVIPTDSREARRAGEAFVVFADQFNAEEGLKRDRTNIQHRYIEVFRSSQDEMCNAMGVPPRRDDYAFGREEQFPPRGRPGPYEREPRGPAGPPSRDYGYGYGGPGGPGGPAAAPQIAPTYTYPGFEGYGGPGGPGGPGPDPYSGYSGYDKPAVGGPGYGYEKQPGPAPNGYSAAYDYGSPNKPAGGPGGPYGFGGPGEGYGGYGGLGSDYGHSAAGPARGGGQPGETWRGDLPRGGPPREYERERAGGRRFVLKMRGIPFRTVEGDVYEFFAPLRPTRVEILTEVGGRPSGEARVEFATRNDYDEALEKDKHYMGSRYVELFPDVGGRF